MLVQIAWFLFFGWLLGGALTLVSLWRQRFLKPSEDTQLTGPDAPPVSILVPARNEERRILAASLRSILAQDYGNFEVVAVNDRSTDATGAILRALAEEDGRLRVVEGVEPPAGWLGKPFALQQALDASRGRWVLATDADMLFHPSALRTAMSYALARDLDAFSIFPTFEAVSFWERVFIPVWGWSFVLLYPLDLVNHPKTPLAAAIGGFFLIRREALRRVGDYGVIRAEVLDDFRLAAILKRSGAKIRAEYAPELARTRMYTNFSGLWESATKNWFSAVGFSLPLAAAMLVWTLLVGVLPALVAVLGALSVALGAGGEVWRQLLAPTLLIWAVQAALLALINRRGGIPVAYGLVAPFGFALACAILADSAFGVLSGRGLKWKGRKFYEREGVRPPRGRAR